MNRDDTIALFEKSENARLAAINAGLSVEEAHEAAKKIWNNWAESLLREREEFQSNGRWAEEGALWEDRARVDFSMSCFVNVEEEAGSTKISGVELIQAVGPQINFKDFIFPGLVSFRDSKFFLEANFLRTRFCGDAIFSSLTFTDVEFSSSVFEKRAMFDKARFESTIYYRNAVFRDAAVFDGAYFIALASFNWAEFFGAAEFIRARFSQQSEFDEVKFHSGADFTETTFTNTCRFREALFNEEAKFTQAIFSGYGEFHQAEFSADAVFQNTRFGRTAYFNEVVFRKQSDFCLAIFEEEVEFREAEFIGEAWLREVKYKDDAKFNRAIFHEVVRFGNSSFHGPAWFIEAEFLKDARFTQSTFEGYNNFTNAVFYEEAVFSAIFGQRAFNMSGVRFVSVTPNFDQAHFTQAPRLDNVTVPVLSIYDSIFRRADSEDIAKYRALRRLAIDAHDHERERLFFKGEMRAKRGTEETIFHPSWWFSLGYDLISDYGQAIVRPTLLWLLLIPVFGSIYYSLASVGNCVGAYQKAVYLSAQNALIIFSANRRREMIESYECLYGKLGEMPVPWEIGYIGLAHTLVSAILLFLILLGLRNMFKIK